MAKVLCYNGKVERYRAADGKAKTVARRIAKNFRNITGRKCDADSKGAFSTMRAQTSEHHRTSAGRLTACFGRALVTGEFQRGEMVCTKTLYNYVTLGPGKNQEY